MIGSYTEKDFDPSHYKEFYEHHHFQPIPDIAAFDVHEYVPRFGWAFDQIAKLEPKTLLDLGCLDGSFALTIARHFGVQVTGVDLTKDGIALAQQRAKKLGLKAKFWQGTLEEALKRMAVVEDKFDMITLFEIMEHVEDPKLVLRLVDKVLAPGGSVLISTPAFEGPTYGMDDEQNKCHIRLYTTQDEDYFSVNKFGTERKATSISKEVGKHRIKEMAVHNELINLRYQ